jgi:type I pantothenate kinase
MPAMVRFLSEVKSGAPVARAPVYSHLTYDIVAGEHDSVHRPDILILEGLNVLQTSPPGVNGSTPVVSDFFDFSIYVDADEALVEDWYVERFLKLRETAFRDPRSYFRRYAELGDADAERIARDIWRRINLPNLRENILPTRPRADLILRKGASHQIEQVALRRL